MKIAVLSDIHDNISNLKKTIEICKNKWVEEIINCGDQCSPFVTRIMWEDFSWPIHVVFGNNDADKLHMNEYAQKFKNIILHGERAELEIEAKKIFVTHYPVYAQHAIETWRFDYVFYGHTHKASEEKIWNCLLVNPWEVAGVFSSPSFAVVDLESGEVENIQI